MACTLTSGVTTAGFGGFDVAVADGYSDKHLVPLVLRDSQGDN